MNNKENIKPITFRVTEQEKELLKIYAIKEKKTTTQVLKEFIATLKY